MQLKQLSPEHQAIVDHLFCGNAGKADSIAVEGVICNIQNPAAMTKDVFLQLQAMNEIMEMCVARGEDCIDEGFDTRHAEVERLLDAAPWVMCPDTGCIPKVKKPTSGASIGM